MTSNKQAPPSAGFFIYVQNEFDTVTALRYYLSHGAQHGAAQIGDKKMTTLIELSQAKHPYYCSESNYYSNEPAQRYETISEFLDAFEDADIDMNLCFRWDVRDALDDDGNPTGECSAEVFLMLQRKGIFMPCSISRIDESEVDRFVAYLKKHHDTIKEMWHPIG